MKHLSATELVTESIEDLDALIPSDKNRSSFLDVEEGAKRGCSRIATIIGHKRTKKWVSMFESGLVFSNIAHLPVWDNGDGTYTLGDGSTRTDAIKHLCKEKGMDVPSISLIIENNKFASKKEFEDEIIVINGTFNGKKWDLCEKVDFLKREGNIYAQQIFDLYDYFHAQTGEDIAFNLVVNIFLDCQGSGKENRILNDLAKLKEGNKYAYEFADFFAKLHYSIKENKQGKKVNIFDQYVLQALFNLYMCVVTKHHDKVDTFYAALIEALSNPTTKEDIRQSKQSAVIADVIMDRIAKNKKNGKDEWYKTMKMVRTDKGMTDIAERGGRCVVFNKDEE